MVTNDQREQNKRVRKYRAAIAAARMRAIVAGIGVSLHQAEAVVAMADAERAELLAEIADRESERADLRDRVEKAEAQIARVEALCDELESVAAAETGDCPDGSCGTCTQGTTAQLVRIALEAE